jgi:deoxyribonucleoside regulator
MTGRQDPDVLRAASMYYLQDLKMDVIARHLGTSRSTVSRLLKTARESGLVEIKINSPSSRAGDLVAAIKDRFDVTAFVVPVPDTASDVDRLEQVSLTAARLVSSWFDSHMVLGIAWGTTLAAVSRQLGVKPTRGSVIVQLNGAANPQEGGVEYAADLISAFGSAFGATVHHFPVPTFFDYAATKEAMWQERSIRWVLDVQRRSDMVLFGVGAMDASMPSYVYTAGYLNEADLALIEAEGVVGDVCTVLLREDGSYEDISLNARATGPTPAELQRVPKRVCVVAGDKKVVPLLGALRAGAVTDLILDELTANKLIEYVADAAK